jgi:serine/threonine-protein kinase
MLLRSTEEGRAEAEAKLNEIPTWESEDIKSTLWALVDEAAEMEQRARLFQITREQKLQGALTHKSDLPEAHAELAAQYRAEHIAAESVRDAVKTQQSEARLVEHANALPADHPDRISHVAYLKGYGALSLLTSERGAEVFLEKYEVQNRRLVATPVKSLGMAPLRSVPMKMGSYRLRVHKKGFHEVLCPVTIGRGEHWDGVAPGDNAPHPLWLPPLKTLGQDDCYIPAGWFWSGGDPLTTTSLPRQKVWMGSLVMKRFPVTNRQYIVFLNDLVNQGREEEALQYVPRERSGQAGQQGAMIYGRNDKGQFILVIDADGDMWELDWPVLMVDWHCSKAYAEWKSKQTSIQWRLPEEFEWEKSARGVDGRFFPWGDGFDASRCCMRDSHKGQRLPTKVDTFPLDESPYGVRGMAGNVMDWTETEYKEKGPLIQGGRVVPERRSSAGDDVSYRVLRGGNWSENQKSSRTAPRGYSYSSSRSSTNGFRLAHTITS